MKIEKLTAMALERVDFDRYLLAAAVGKRAEAIANGAAPVVNMDPKVDKFTDIALVEIAEGKIFSEALEIDFYKENFLEEIAKLDKNKKYLLYCHSGNRSGQALKIFRQLGFAEAYDLDGGISNWSKALER